MADIKFSALPTVASAQLSDVYAAVQAGVSVQLTASQILDLIRDEIILSFAGDPNGNVSGTLHELCFDTANNNLYICTTAGVPASAVWTLIGTDLGAMADGQLLIGNSTTNIPNKNTIAAGTGISIVNGPGTINISHTGLMATFTEVTGTSQNMSANAGYISNNAAQVSLLLPSTANIGDAVYVLGKGAGGWRITQNSGQIIHIGSNASTTGATGYVESGNQYDSLTLVCITANTEWSALNAPQGTLTVI